jgi:hypothetical protein
MLESLSLLPGSYVTPCAVIVRLAGLSRSQSCCACEAERPFSKHLLDMYRAPCDKKRVAVTQLRHHLGSAGVGVAQKRSRM